MAALILAELLTLTQVLFCMWMLAHPLNESAEWSERLKVRLLTSAVLGVAIVLVGVKRWRRKREMAG